MLRLIAGSMMAFAIWGFGLVHGAIVLDGSHLDVSMPVTEENPSPIADTQLFDPNQHGCPTACLDFSNPHSWMLYTSVNRLRVCKERMLLDFSVNQPLDGPASRILIRACTVQADRPGRPGPPHF